MFIACNEERNAIDSFVLAKLEQAGMQPSTKAYEATLDICAKKPVSPFISWGNHKRLY